jgi:Fe-S cluster assembly protein SufD
VIESTAGASIETPIELLHLTTSDAAVVAFHTRNAIVAMPGSSATVIETFLHEAATVYWSQPVTEIRVGAGATLRHYKDQNEGSKAFHTAATDVRVCENGRYENFVLTTGAAVAQRISVVLDGRGLCSLDSAYLARGRHMPQRRRSSMPSRRRPAPGLQACSTSRRARSSGPHRRGKGHRRPTAINQQTILLSDRAEIDAKPEPRFMPTT